MTAAVSGAAAVIRPPHGGRSLQVSPSVARQDWLSSGASPRHHAMAEPRVCIETQHCSLTCSNELIASFPQRKSLPLRPEGKPTGTDESGEVGREGAALQHVWPVRSRGALVAHAWLFSVSLKKFDALTNLATRSVL